MSYLTFEQMIARIHTLRITQASRLLSAVEWDELQRLERNRDQRLERLTDQIVATREKLERLQRLQRHMGEAA